MKKQVGQTKGSDAASDMAEFETVATRLEDRLDRLGISEKDLLDAAAKVRERMLTEVYGLEAEELVQP
jgi:hypothetical protein